MKTLIGGAIAALLGLIGVDELKDTWKPEESTEPDAAIDDNVEKYKQEISELKDEIDTLKKE